MNNKDPFGEYDPSEYSFPSQLCKDDRDNDYYRYQSAPTSFGDVVEFLLSHGLNKTLECLSDEYDHHSFFGENKVVHEDIPLNFIRNQKAKLDCFDSNLLTVLFEEDIGDLLRVIVFSVKGSISFVDDNGTLLSLTENPLKAPVLCIDVNPVNPEIYIIGLMDGSHSVWRISDDYTISVVQTFKDHSKYVVSVLWSPDGTFFVTASRDGSVALYDFDLESEVSSQSRVVPIWSFVEYNSNKPVF